MVGYREEASRRESARRLQQMSPVGVQKSAQSFSPVAGLQLRLLKPGPSILPPEFAFTSAGGPADTASGGFVETEMQRQDRLMDETIRKARADATRPAALKAAIKEPQYTTKTLKKPVKSKLAVVEAVTGQYIAECPRIDHPNVREFVANTKLTLGSFTDRPRGRLTSRDDENGSLHVQRLGQSALHVESNDTGEAGLDWSSESESESEDEEHYRAAPMTAATAFLAEAALNRAASPVEEGDWNMLSTESEGEEGGSDDGSENGSEVDEWEERASPAASPTSYRAIKSGIIRSAPTAPRSWGSVA